MNRVILSLTLLAGGYAVGVSVYLPASGGAAILNLSYYLLLLVNTYFSLTFTEREFHIRNGRDGLLNLVLTGFYLAMPWFVQDTERFHLYMAAFFAVAVVKYANWLGRPEAAFFLSRKIPINAGGAFLSLTAATCLNDLGAVYDIPVAASTLAIFGLANVGVLIVDPLYRAR